MVKIVPWLSGGSSSIYFFILLVSLFSSLCLVSSRQQVERPAVFFVRADKENTEENDQIGGDSGLSSSKIILSPKIQIYIPLCNFPKWTFESLKLFLKT